MNINQTWKQHGITKAGGHGNGSQLNQLSDPIGFYVDEDQTIYVADTKNHRIVEWKSNATEGSIVAGGNGQGNRTDQLNRPTKVIIDKESDSLIICDPGNERIVQWPYRNGRRGETLISGIKCWDLMMDDDRSLYVADVLNSEVRRWKIGEKNGTIVVGGNEFKDSHGHLSGPFNIFIDQDYSVYVSNNFNHRVIKWKKGEKEGTIVAGGHGKGSDLEQFFVSSGIVVDQLGSIYIADGFNHRVMRWSKDADKGSVVVGGNGKGNRSNQFDLPVYLSFDRQNNLYVLDRFNHRVQKFDVEILSNIDQ